MYRHSPSKRTDSPVAARMKDANAIKTIVRELHDVHIGDRIEEELINQNNDRVYLIKEIGQATVRLNTVVRKYGNVCKHKAEYQEAVEDLKTAVAMLLEL